MKRFFLFLMLFLFAFSWQSIAQTPKEMGGGTSISTTPVTAATTNGVSIGNGTEEQGLPVDPYYGYSYSQCIYLQTEIEAAGDITTLTWDFAGSSISNSNDWTIYIGHTTKSDFTSGTDWVDVSTLTQVFSGIVTVDANNKVVVDITDFTYNNTDNLIIAVDENADDYNSTSDDFYATSTTADRGIRYRNDSTNPDPASPPSGSAISYIANVELGGIATSITAPDCASSPTPSDGAMDIDVESTGGNLTLTWIASSTGDPATSYEVLFGTTSGNLSSIGTVTSPTIDITGLNMGTQYYWSIVPSNVGGAATGCAEWSFTTAAATMYCTPAPASVDGNGLTNVTFSTVNNTSPPLTTAPYYSDFTAMVGDVTAGASENISVTYETGYSYDTWIWIDWNDDFDFDDADEAQYLGNSSSSNPTTENWTFIVPASAPAGNHRMRIGGADSGLGSTTSNPCYTGSYGEFEDYTVNVMIPACLGVSDLTATPSTDAVSLSWTGNGSATNWDVEYGLSGFALGTGTSDATTVTNYTASGLAQGTDYDFYVRANCGSGFESDWLMVSSTTLVPAPANDLCANPTTLTLDLNACGANTITGISNVGTTDSGEPAPSCGSYGTPTTVGDLWYSVTIPAGVTAATFNTMNVTGMTSVAGAIYSGTCGSLTELDCTEFGGGWPWEVTGLTSGETYLLRVWDYDNDQEGTFDLCGVYITCPAPSGIAVDNITQTGADITWTTGGATDWEVAIVPAGDSPTSGEAVTGTAAYTATNLMSSTEYDVYVRDNCGSDYSSWVGPVSFTTECSTFTPDYSQDFADFLPVCWDQATDGDLASGPTGLNSSSWFSSTNLGQETAKINLYSADHSDWLLTPTFDLSGANYEISIDVAVTNYNSGDADPDGMGSDDEVQLVYSDDGGTTWTSINSWTASDNLTNSLTTFTFPAPSSGNAVQFGLLGTDGPVNDLNDYDFHVDNFSITAPAVCDAPTSVTVSDITATGANINWTSGGATAWEVAIVNSGAGAPTTGEATTSNPYAAANLAACTSFDVYVRDDCGSGMYSAWSSAASFTTLSTLAAIDIADQSVCASATTVDLTALEPAGQTGGVWTIGGVVVTDATSETVADANTYTYTLTDGACVETDDVTYTVAPNLVINIADQEICASENPVDLTALEPTGQTGGTWSVSPANAYTVSDGESVTYSYTDGNGCSGSVNVTYTVHANPTIVISNQTIDDTDNPVDLTALEPAGQTGGSWSVSPANAYTVSDGETVTYTYADANGCEGTADVTFTVNTTSSCPGAGAIVITEIMKNPAAIGDNDGEWFEVYNTTGAAIDMSGWTIKDDGSNAHVIGASIMVPANGYAVFGNNADSGTNGGFTVDYEYSGFTLGNGTDEVVLVCSGSEIDRVNYNDADFPDDAGASMSLDPAKFNATDNDDGANWCSATTAYASGDLGTPGATNDNCGGCTPPVIDIADQTMCASANPVDLTSLEPTGQTGGTWALLGDPISDATAEQVGDGVTYTYTWTNASGCEGSDNVTFTVNANLTVSVSDATICASENPVDLAGFEPTGQTGGSWSVATPYSAADGDVLTYTYTDGNGCEGSGDMTFTVNANPTVSVSDATICASENPVDLVGLEPTGQTGGSWSVATPYSAADGDVVTYTYTDGNGCAGADNMTFTVLASPVVAIANQTIDATDNPVDLTALEPAGQTGGTWSVSQPDAYTVSDGEVVTYTYTDANGCAGSTNVTFTVNVGQTVPDCTTIVSPIDGSTDVSVNANLLWNAVVNTDGYTLTVGTTPGGNDIVDHLDVVSAYYMGLGTLPYGQTIYVSIVPFNAVGSATDCTYSTFTTEALAVDPIAVYYVNTALDNYGYMPTVTIEECGTPPGFVGLPFTGGIHMPLTGAQFAAQNLSATGGCSALTYEYWDIITNNNPCNFGALRAFKVTDACGNFYIVKQILDYGPPALSVMQTSTNTAIGNFGFMTPVSGITCSNGDVNGLPLTAGIHQSLTLAQMNAQDLTITGGCDVTYEYWDIVTNGGDCTTGMQVLRAFRVNTACGSYTVKQMITVDATPVLSVGLTETSTGTVLSNYGFMSPATVSCAANGNVDGLALTNGVHHSLTAAEFAAQDLTVTNPCHPMTYEYWDLNIGGGNCATGTSILRAFRVSGACGVYTVKKMITVNTIQGYATNSGLNQDAMATLVKDNGLSIDLSPNPASDVLTVKVGSSYEGDAYIQIVNGQGVLVQTERSSLVKGLNGFTYNVSKLPTGVYFLKVTNGETQKVERFIVR